MTVRAEFLNFKTNVDLSGLKRADSMVDSLVGKVNSISTAFDKVGNTSKRFGNQFDQIGTSANKAFSNAASNGERTATALSRSSEKISRTNKETQQSYDDMSSGAKKYRSEAGQSLDEVATRTENSSRKIQSSLSKTTNGMKAGFNKGSTSARTYSKSVGALTSVHDRLLSGARSAGIGILGVGAAFVSGAKKAIDLQNSYKETTNLIVNGGEKQAEAIKNVSAMQSDGAKFSMKYGKSQKEIASGYQELVKRGYTSTQALGAMKSMLQASVASGDGFSDVVSNSTAALESFGMRAKTTAGMIKNTKIATNEMAYASDLTATDFKSMGEAMTYVGATAHQAHLSLAETSAAIGSLSNSGLEGTVAGTGLRKVLNSLISPTKGGVDALKQMGLTTKDLTTNGHLKSLAAIFTTLNKQTKGMSAVKQGQLFKALFGATGQAAATVLTQSASSLGKLNKQVENSVKTNYIGKLANKNMSSAKNQLAIFKETFNNMQTVFAAKLLPYVTKAAKVLTTIIGKFSELPKSTQGWLVGITLTTTALGGTAFVIGGILEKVTAIKTFFGQWKSSSKPSAGQDIISQQNGELQEQKKLLEETSALKQNSGSAGSTAPITETRVGSTHFTSPIKYKDEASVTQPTTWIGRLGRNTKNVGSAIAGGAISRNSNVVTRGIARVTSSKITRAIPVVGSAVMAGSTLLSAKPGKMGSAAGSAAGSIAGGAAGSLLGPVTGVLGSVAGGVIGQQAGSLFDSKKSSGTSSAIAKLKTNAKKLSIGVKDAMALITKPIGSKQSNAAQVSINKTFGKMTPTIEKAVFGIRGALGKLGSGFKTVMKPMKSFGSWLSKTFGKTFRSLGKTVQPVFRDIGNAMSSMGRTFSRAINKYFGGRKSGLSKSIANTLRAMISFAKPVIKIVSKTLVGSFKVIAAGVRGAIDLIKNIFNSSIGSWVKIFRGGLKTISGVFNLFGDLFRGNWKKLGKDIGQIASGLWDTVSGVFEAGINGVIGVINTGLDGINGLINKLPKKIRPNWHLHISPVHFANGTGIINNNLLTRQNGQHAHTGGPMVVNDAKSGPHHELVILPTGQAFVPRGRDVMFNAPRGTEVINGRQTKQLLGAHYAAGTTNVRGKSLDSATDATKSLDKFSKKNKSIWNASSSDTSKAVKKIGKTTTNGYKTATSKMSKSLSSWKKTNKSDLNSTSKDTTTFVNRIYKTAVNKYGDLKSSLSKTSSSIDKQWHNVWSDMSSFFNKEFGKLAGYAHHGMAGAISELNGGIRSIDVVIGKFGGNDSVLPTMHYAQGSKGPIQNDQLAIVNDAKTGHHHEAIVAPNGSVAMPHGRDVATILPKGAEVLNGDETHAFMEAGILPHYAKGTDGLKRIASSISKNPQGSFDKTFEGGMTNAVVKGLSQVGKSMATTAKGAIESVGGKWYQAMFEVINNAIDGGGVGGSAKKFVDAALSKRGDPYVWGAKGPNEFDCSGLVEWAAKQAGINLPAPSGNQFSATRAVSQSEAKKGDLAFYGPGGNEHVAIYMGGESTFAARDPAEGVGNSLLHGPSGFAGLRRIPGLKWSDDSKKDKSNNGLQKLAKAELGSKALKWIENNLGDSANYGNPGGAGVQRWGQLVVKAAKYFGINPSNSDVNKVLADIRHESGGNPTVTNNWDSNAKAGIPSTGLLQFIQSTFDHYAVKGHTNIHNGYDQLLAGWNDRNFISDINPGGGWGPTGGRRRAKGGKTKKNEPYLVGELGPEIFQPDQDGEISSYQKTKRLFEGPKKPSKSTTVNFNPTININVSGGGDSDEVAKKVAAIVGEEIQKQWQKIKLSLGDDGEVII